MADVAPVVSKQMERDGVKPPEDLTKQPKLRSNLICYLDAFYDLDTERSHSHGTSRIPWSAINYYGAFYRYDLDELHFFIRKMDDALIASMSANPGGDSGTGPHGAREVVQRPPRPD